MQITKYERIIFLERDISATESNIKKWTQYAEGLVDLEAKYKHVLDEAEEAILEIGKLISENTVYARAELDRFVENFYDNHYYDYNSAKECAEDYLNRYAEIARTEAKELYDCKIKSHSKETAVSRLAYFNSELEKQQKKHKELIAHLSFIERIILKWTRNSPTARINSSPSFIMCYVGDNITVGFMEGLNEK